jgi:hypothetical protein
MPPAGKAVATPVANHMPFSADQFPHLETRHIGTQTDDLPGELVPNCHRGRDRRPCPVVPVEDVDVGATDPRCEDADQDIIRARLGNRDVLQTKADLFRVLDQGSHSQAQTGSRLVPAAA